MPGSDALCRSHGKLSCPCLTLHPKKVLLSLANDMSIHFFFVYTTDSHYSIYEMWHQTKKKKKNQYMNLNQY